jgi:hypothetical protein
MGRGYLGAWTTGLVAKFWVRYLPSNGISIEKMSMSIKLSELKYCSKQFLKENPCPIL